jgi:hypothetical protein
VATAIGRLELEDGITIMPLHICNEGEEIFLFPTNSVHRNGGGIRSCEQIFEDARILKATRESV